MNLLLRAFFLSCPRKKWRIIESSCKLHRALYNNKELDGHFFFACIRWDIIECCCHEIEILIDSIQLTVADLCEIFAGSHWFDGNIDTVHGTLTLNIFEEQYIMTQLFFDVEKNGKTKQQSKTNSTIKICWKLYFYDDRCQQ